RPFVAGLFVSLAIGNRIELALCLLVFIYFLVRRIAPDSRDLKSLVQHAREKSRVFVYFLIVPLALGFFTALYNYARFHSIFDFGYSHIPKVLQYSWY